VLSILFFDRKRLKKKKLPDNTFDNTFHFEVPKVLPKVLPNPA